MFYLKKLKLTNYRCYLDKELDFSKNINILIGNNAVGKTSVVEAVHCLAFGKSHRSNNDMQLINKDNDFAIVKGTFAIDDKIEEVIFSITDKGKKILKNHKPFKNLSDYIGFLNVIMFCPEDLDLIKGSPSERRKFLDLHISQINPIYLRSSINYRKILKERNEILRKMNEEGFNDFNLLKTYTDALINEAKIIIFERNKFFERINPYLYKKITAISDKREIGQIIYKPNVEIGEIEKVFNTNQKNDIYYKTTQKGPHRDDFSFLLNNEDASIYGSQGQQRTVVLALKLALAELISENYNNLIIILDDVFSELDLTRQNQILELLNNQNQIFITTTTIDNISEAITKDSSIINIIKEVE